MENIGRHSQPLVRGTVIDAKLQEDFGLLSLGGSCSASLLRNDWAVSAAHCLDLKDANGNVMPDPARPGQNILQPLAGLTLTANWDPAQTRGVLRVETFWPYDVALIQLNAPFKVYGSTTGYSRVIFQDGQFPYFGEPSGADLLIFGRGIYIFASGEGDAATPSVSDGQYRVGYSRVGRTEDHLYWYPSVDGQMIAGGDSGGPSFAWTLSGYVLVGVHALATVKYVPGKPAIWTWVTSSPEAADAPLMPLLSQLYQIMGPAPATVGALNPFPPTGNVGTFAATPPDYKPIWLYGILPNGDLKWYRKDTHASAWQGPEPVGTGWNGFKDVIAAGGNRFYALTQDDKLIWYQHNGFNTGTFDWNGGIEVGHGWTFKRIFAGGDGIIYAIRQDGILCWYRHLGYKDGSHQWSQNTEIGNGWDGFLHVFSLGKGEIYAVRPDGTLLLYSHKGYETGAYNWAGPRVVGSEWHLLRQIIPVGDGVILVIRLDGNLGWYNHLGRSTAENGRYIEVWEPDVNIGSHWDEYGKVFTIMASAPDGVG